MPRTKISKNSKRNRDAAHREEKLREFAENLDQYISALDNTGQQLISDVDQKLNFIMQTTNKFVLQMTISEMIKLHLKKFADWSPTPELLVESTISHSTCNSVNISSQRSIKATGPNDEGYLTEDSNMGSNSLGVTPMPTLKNGPKQISGRTPGPLDSARARRIRRSRSACGNDYLPPGSTIKSKLTAGESTLNRASRSKMRTPMISRSKAFSADRSPTKSSTMYKSPPSAFMRWPKPGEIAISTCGSPLVTVMQTNDFANVNIPTKGGVLSLRPKKLGELKPEFIEAIDAETISQIKTLNDNLQMIMDKYSKKSN